MEKQNVRKIEGSSNIESKIKYLRSLDVTRFKYIYTIHLYLIILNFY